MLNGQRAMLLAFMTRRSETSAMARVLCSRQQKKQTPKPTQTRLNLDHSIKLRHRAGLIFTAPAELSSLTAALAWLENRKSEGVEAAHLRARERQRWDAQT